MSKESTSNDIAADLSERLTNLSETDALTFLGIQAERLELSEQRLAGGRPIPAWSDEEAYAKLTSEQRASLEDLVQYAAKGREYAKKMLVRLDDQLRLMICHRGTVKQEILDLEKDAKEIVKYVASGIVGLVAASLPAAVAAAAATIATVLAVILLKQGLGQYCAVGTPVSVMSE